MKTSKIILTLFLSAALIFQACNKDDDDPVVDPDNPDPDSGEKVEGIDTISKFKVAKMVITTENGATINGKDKADYVNCTIAIESEKEEWNTTVTGRIRGRGNSSWKWYDKKPYRLKLDEKSKILGLRSNKDWNLLANYRDATDLMNTFVFELGQLAGLGYTNNTRYVEITLNGDYIGLYQLTETIEAAKDRVDIDKDNGIILSLDADDGPELSPDATDNFWSEVYYMPCCVKNPDKPTAAQVKAVMDEFAELEYAVYQHDYNDFSALADIDAFINYLLIQELVYNVEVAAPRSIYLYKDVNQKWGFGPLWDFDAGYDFDWGSMYTGHNFFMSYKESVLGTDPKTHDGGYSYVPEFFTDMFRSKEFVQHVQNNWLDLAGLIPQAWANAQKYDISAALERDLKRWPIDKSPTVETKKMGDWLTNRTNYMNTVVGGY